MAYIIPVLVLVLAVAAISMIAMRRQPHDGSFGDYLINFKSFSRRMETQSAEEKAVVAELANQPPEKAVEMLLDDPDLLGPPSKAIKQLGEESVPALIQAISDPRFRSRTTQVPNHFGAEPTPLAAVLRCLADFAPRDALPHALALIDDDDQKVRRQAIRLLCCLGDDETIKPIQRLLTDDDEFVRSDVTRGIVEAVTAKRTSARFRSTLFDTLADRCFDQTLPSAPACLLALDKERAIPILTRSDRFVRDQENLSGVMRALSDSDVKVAEPQLLRLYEECEARADELEEDRIAAQTLTLLGNRPSPQALDAIKRGLSHPSKWVRDSAAEAMAQAQDLGSAIDHAQSLAKQLGWQNLSEEQRHVLAVRSLIDIVRGDGFLGYFAHPSGDHWSDALEGLAAIGATDTERLLSQAIEKLGATTQQTSEQRRRQVAKLAKTSRRPFREIEGEFYRDGDHRESLLVEYISRHADHFR